MGLARYQASLPRNISIANISVRCKCLRQLIGQPRTAVRLRLANIGEYIGRNTHIRGRIGTRIVQNHMVIFSFALGQGEDRCRKWGQRIHLDKDTTPFPR